MPHGLIAIPRGRRVIAEDYVTLLREANVLHIPTNAGWTAIVTGSGATLQLPSRLTINTGATASSTALLRQQLAGFGLGAAGLRLDWRNKLVLVFQVRRATTDAEVVARVQLKETTAIGQMAERGFGLEVANFAMTGESYGTARGAVDLGTSLTDNVLTQIVIVHEPAIPRIEWYTAESGQGVLRGTQSTAANMPSVLGTVDMTLIVSIARGATGVADSEWDMAQPKIWQAR